MAADDPAACEQPIGFDRDVAMEELRSLHPELAAILGEPLELDEQVQDASFFAELAFCIPGSQPRALDTVLAVRFSAFGRLFTIWSHCPTQPIEAEQLAQIINTVESRGFRYVDTASLDEPYHGRNPLFGGSTWWYRFFDYL